MNVKYGKLNHFLYDLPKKYYTVQMAVMAGFQQSNSKYMKIQEQQATESQSTPNANIKLY